MKFKPHDYQKYATEFIKTHPQSAILLDMGLGKTSITLTALSDLLFDSFEIRKVLVIAPVRVAKFSWPDEIVKWDHLQHLTYAVAVGTPAQRLSALRACADITIVNRENVCWLVEDSGVAFDYDCIVIDELSSFKNHQAKRFKALLKVRPKVKRVIALTGTPASNGLMDLWAEFRLIDLGERLGRYITRYREAYFRPDKTNGMIVYSYKPLPGAEEAIYKRISDITISMRAEDHISMPERILTTCLVNLSEEEEKRYKRLKNDLLLTLPEGEITAASAAALTSKLSQLANGAIYTDDGSVLPVHDRKLDALEDIIEAAGGKPILVCYWFRHDRIRIEKRLAKIHVKYAGLEQDAGMREWNAGKLPVGLIHPASAGHGLNLQSGGSTIVWFGSTWSLELYQQTNARLWRQGQRARTVVIMHIVAKGTVDERILKVLEKKDDTQSALIEAVKAEIGDVREVIQ
ncbi:DEAD/DEAH box helicase [Eubacterium sp. AB3007]|uniref:DEAD/DEAH box helicase n=1 Tax=Eubacterium sp. AB3007 TaxID=1392487 RepID=UPI00047FC220|nr:DEAD/DEAH box helicase [Eubacterium sp. AB3007]